MALTEHLAWWGRERSAKRVTVSPAEAISGPLYKPPPCAPLYIFVHLCTKPPPTFPEQISQWSSGRTIGTSAPEPPSSLAYLVARLGALCCLRQLDNSVVLDNLSTSSAPPAGALVVKRV